MKTSLLLWFPRIDSSTFEMNTFEHAEDNENGLSSSKNAWKIRIYAIAKLFDEKSKFYGKARYTVPHGALKYGHTCISSLSREKYDHFHHW